ncbi:MAG: desulfoferrodoxin FeS4 iron-binding domain-containing protein [Nitrospirota bacterium]|nr:desulfoferrodoxin FeS4 iron-binding domain-containing protein [Nitrospirota bacterium]
MGVKSVGEKYRCEKCGNEVVVTRAGGGTLVCCGEDMKKVEG